MAGTENRWALRQLFGTEPDPVDLARWLEVIAQQIAGGRRQYLAAHHNLHSLYMLHHTAAVRAFYARCDHCYADGVPVRWLLARADISSDPAHRFTLMDDFSKLLRFAEQKQWSLFYLGSREDVVSTARQQLHSQFPLLNITLHNGYIDDNQTLLAHISQIKPDLLLVGMGMPLQEEWIMANIDQLDVAVITQAGATLDYYTRAQARPPRWLSRCGFGWLFRLLHHPRRLAYRYLIEPWALLRPILTFCWSSHRKKRTD